MPKPAPARESEASVEKTINGFIDEFTPENAKLLRNLRAFLRKLYPAANELVYDYSTYFVVGYGFTERGSDCLVSFAANADGVRLYFNRANSFKDPDKLLKGSGKQVRYIVVSKVADLRDKRVQDFFRQTEVAAGSQPVKSGKGPSIIKSASAKKQSRR